MAIINSREDKCAIVYVILLIVLWIIGFGTPFLHFVWGIDPPTLSLISLGINGVVVLGSMSLVAYTIRSINR